MTENDIGLLETKKRIFTGMTSKSVQAAETK